ncbi:hypothetical protein [Halobacteriovorax sp. HLS]|uniref:hypothetical protein n=1 Tax=Halobacteriovorax sp. HLS TaxID=2234000 RepID=UPI000FDA6D30|nr:hypothetical protein [Halobacteriovorax sp. HLS]
MKILTIQEDKNIYQRVGLLVLLFFISINSQAKTLTVAILDTAFCPTSERPSPTIHIRRAIDLTKTHNIDCSKVSAKEISSNRLFHGQLVLNRFIEELSNEIKVDIQPFQIFDKNGFTRPSYWEDALVDNKKFDLFIIAAGVKVKSVHVLKVPTLAFVAGATFGRGINKTTKLWPQVDFRKSNIITIGSYLLPADGLKERSDHTLIHPKRMKYFFAAGTDSEALKGSSRAVATAAARSINTCHDQFGKVQSVIDCLEKKKKILNLEANKQVQTY